MHAFVPGNPLRSLVVLAGSAWRWALLAGLGLVVVALLVPSFSGLATAASGALPVAAIGFSLHRHRPRHARPWLLIGGGLGLYWVGHTIAIMAGARPALLEIAMVAGYVGVLAGIVAILSDGDGEDDASTLLEALILAAAAGLVVWFWTIAPLREDPGRLGIVDALEALAYPAIDLAMFALAGRALLRYREIQPALWLLLPALLATATTDISGLLAFAAGVSPVAWLTEGGSLTANAFVAAAALHPSVTRSVFANPREAGRWLRARIALVGGATLIAPAMMLVYGLEAEATGRHVESLEVAIGAFVISGLVVADLYLLLTRADDSLRERKALTSELERQVHSDSLTRLPNRAAFAARLRELATADLERAAVLFCDLDDFKTINDTLGHAAGDELLVEVGGRLRGAIRPGDLAARLGGDEFAVLIEDLGTPEGADRLARRILEGFAAPLVVAGVPIDVRMSIGIALGRDAHKPSDLMRRADIAMYAAKARGKGAFVRFHAEPEAMARPA